MNKCGNELAVEHSNTNPSDSNLSLEQVENMLSGQSDVFMYSALGVESLDLSAVNDVAALLVSELPDDKSSNDGTEDRYTAEMYKTELKVMYEGFFHADHFILSNNIMKV